MIQWLIAKIGLKYTLILGVVLLGLVGFGGWRAWDAFGDWLDARTIAKLQAQNAALTARVDALEAAAALQAAANEAATTAENRNNAEIPRARAAAAVRAHRPGADLPQRVSDDQAALADYAAAADQLPGARPR